MSLEEIVRYLHVDSLAYLGIEELKTAIGAGDAGWCDACLTGRYPTSVPVDLAGAQPEPPERPLLQGAQLGA